MMRPLLLMSVALLSAAALAPPAAAAEVQSTVLLHDLYEDGAYAGCHVTTTSFRTFRLTVNEGDHVVLTVQAPENNTNAHYLTVEGVDGQTAPLTAGESATFEFDADWAGSRAVLCDGKTSPLQGVVIAKAARSGAGDERNDTPAPGVLAALGVVGLTAIARASYRRRRL